MVQDPKEINGRSALTLDGSSETNRSISFSHPRLDFVAGDERTGREEGAGRRGGGGRPKQWGEYYNGICCFSKSQISL